MVSWRRGWPEALVLDDLDDVNKGDGINVYKILGYDDMGVVSCCCHLDLQSLSWRTAPPVLYCSSTASQHRDEPRQRPMAAWARNSRLPPSFYNDRTS